MAGKRTNELDKWLPPRVYRGKSRYEYRPGSGETIKLCFLPKDGIETEAIKAEVWAQLAKLKEAPPEVDDMSKLIAAYHRSMQFAALSPNTQADYNHYSKRIIRVFGHMLPSHIKAPHIRQFMDALAEQGKIVTANRHHSYMSILFSWGLERSWVELNPAKQVRKFREKPRDRYIEDWEYEKVHKIASESAYPYLAPMMEFAYLMRARTIELRALTEADITADGIYLRRTKGSIAEVTGWSERLRKALAVARSLFPDAPTNLKRPIFHSKTGAAIPKESFKTAWGRIMKQAMAEGLKERFTFHDIKAKGVSDHNNKSGGHRSKKMQAVYDRKPGVIPSTK